MAYAMTKHGTLDNVATNEFICDTAADLATIPTSEITLGSVAFVIADLEAYIANSSKEWVSMTPTSEDETEPGGEE